MATHKSALKRMRQAEKERIRNKSRISRMKTEIKRVLEAVEEKNVDSAKVALKDAMQQIGKTAAKGAIKKQTASRKISRLSKAVHKLSV